VSATLIGSILAAVLTLMVFSYLLGNNPLYRLAQHIFVGVSIGYAALLLLGNVLIPQLVPVQRNPSSLGSWLVLLPVILGVLLLVRLVRPGARQSGLLLGLATLGLNIAVSTAAALAVGGALLGTLVPQVAGTMRPLTLGGSTGDLAAWGTLIGNLIVVLGVIASLFYFQFSVRPSGIRSAPGRLVAGAGRWLIIVALGATLGALTVSFVSALVERVQFLFNLPSQF
jgi:hypothetical protein